MLLYAVLSRAKECRTSARCRRRVSHLPPVTEPLRPPQTWATSAASTRRASSTSQSARRTSSRNLQPALDSPGDARDNPSIAADETAAVAEEPAAAADATRDNEMSSPRRSLSRSFLEAASSSIHLPSPSSTHSSHRAASPDGALNDSSISSDSSASAARSAAESAAGDGEWKKVESTSERRRR